MDNEIGSRRKRMAIAVMRALRPAVPAVIGAAALTFLFAAVMPLAWVTGISWNLYLDRLRQPDLRLFLLLDGPCGVPARADPGPGRAGTVLADGRPRSRSRGLGARGRRARRKCARARGLGPHRADRGRGRDGCRRHRAPGGPLVCRARNLPYHLTPAGLGPRPLAPPPPP